MSDFKDTECDRQRCKWLRHSRLLALNPQLTVITTWLTGFNICRSTYTKKKYDTSKTWLIQPWNCSLRWKLRTKSVFEFIGKAWKVKPLYYLSFFKFSVHSCLDTKVSFTELKASLHSKSWIISQGDTDNLPHTHTLELNWVTNYTEFEQKLCAGWKIRWLARCKKTLLLHTDGVIKLAFLSIN